MSLFKLFFNKILIYTALGIDDYFQVSQAFKSERLYYKVKSKSYNRTTPGGHFTVNDFRAPVIYDFYVKKEDEYKAQKILSTIKK